jgi:hypothetical protein
MCAKPFDSSVPATKILAKTSRPKIQVQNDIDDDDDDDCDFVGSLVIPKKLSIEVEVDKPERVTFGSLLQGDNDSAVFKKQNKELSKVKRKEQISQFQQRLRTVTRHEIGGAKED